MVLTKVFNILLLCKLKIRFLDAQNQHDIRQNMYKVAVVVYNYCFVLSSQGAW